MVSRLEGILERGFMGGLVRSPWLAQKRLNEAIPGAVYKIGKADRES